MFNPLVGDLTKLKDTELELKVLDLGKKYNSAMRLGMGGAAQQIAMTLDMYRYELNKRQRAAMETTLTKQNKDLDGLINID
jgi:hypothetical protein